MFVPIRPELAMGTITYSVQLRRTHSTGTALIICFCAARKQKISMVFRSDGREGSQKLCIMHDNRQWNWLGFCLLTRAYVGIDEMNCGMWDNLRFWNVPCVTSFGSALRVVDLNILYTQYYYYGMVPTTCSHPDSSPRRPVAPKSGSRTVLSHQK